MPGGKSEPSPAPSPTPGSLGSSNVEFPNQQHLKDVHKKFRIIEGTRRIYHGESEGIMRRQEALLANIRTDSRSLREMVDTYFIPDYNLQMARLQEEAEKYTELVEAEAKRLQGLELAVEEAYSERLEYKEGQGGVNAARDKHRTALIHIQIVENRIHKAVVDLNIVERQNRSLKRKMEEIREEREYFDSIRSKLEKELQWKEKEMEKCIELCSLMYEERNDIEERYTDVLEMHGDMEAYKMWKDTEGWAVIEPEPLENFLLVQRKEDEPEEPRESSEHFRQWIDIKAMANIQDILKVDNVADILQAVQNLQQTNAASIDLVHHLIIEMDTIDAVPRQMDVIIESIPPDPTVKIINRKHDMELTVDSILDLLKELSFDDEEYMPIIRELKRQVGNIFQEAGCPIDDNEVTDEKGKARLEEALGRWYNAIDNFVDGLTKQIQQQRKKKP